MDPHTTTPTEYPFPSAAALAIATMGLFLTLVAACAGPAGGGSGNDNTNANANANDNDNDNISGCATTADCPEDMICRDGACTPLPRLSVEVGYTDFETDVYTPVADDMDMPFYAGFQGLSELPVTIRVSGLSAVDEETLTFQIDQVVTLVETDFVVHEFTGAMVQFVRLTADEAEVHRRTLILDSPPGSIDGRVVLLSISLTLQLDGRPLNAALARRVTLSLAR